MKLPFKRNSLYYADCFEIMQSWLDQSLEGMVDLIYLDPPFNSKTNYNYLYGTKNGTPAQVRAFSDTWKWGGAAQERLERFHLAVAHSAHKAVLGLETALGPSGMLAYLTYMAERLELMRRLLKESGSIYLHCDPAASHYLKIVMDAVFGPKNFQNEIIWSYRTGGASKKRWPRKHDTILFYQKSGKYQHMPEQERVIYKKAFFGTSIDKAGRHYTDVLVRDVWDTIKPLINVSKERLGYPTQKPRALLERIIKASSTKGDLVLDPFCGCGTTIDAAQRLNRDWIGIDISPLATGLIRNIRLRDSSIPIYGIPTDMEGAKQLLQANHFHFEAWVITSISGLAPNEVQVGDGGIDGRGGLPSCR